MSEHGEQLDFFKPSTKSTIEEFLTSWIALEEEEDRIREDKRDLKEQYAEDMTMRAVLTAVKVVRAQMKLHYHEKEPTMRTHQVHYERLVRDFLEKLRAEKKATATEAEAIARGSRETVSMTTGEVA